jgi:hypothetical protein
VRPQTAPVIAMLRSANWFAGSLTTN